MTGKKNSSPTHSGRQSAAQGAAGAPKPIAVNGVMLTEGVLNTLRDIQEQERGLTAIEMLRKVSRLVITVGLNGVPENVDLFELLGGLSDIEVMVEDLLPYGYTLEKEEVCHA